MKKLKIKRNLKRGLLILSTVLLFVFSFIIYREVQFPEVKEEKITNYTYNSKANAGYKVFLKPNMIYQEEVLGDGKIIITQFIDKINGIFNYEYNCDKESEIKGSYEIIATLESYSGGGKSYKTIWKKNYVLLPKTSFHKKDTKLVLTEEVPIDLNEYVDFVEKFKEETKISTLFKVTVYMDVNLSAEAEKGAIEEKMMPSMIIPLGNSYFQIAGNLSEEKPGTIEETIQKQLPIDRRKVTTSGIILGLSVIGLFFLIFFTRGVVKVDSYMKKIKKIFNKHGDRLVALNSELAVTCEQYSEVNSIDDIVRIADEIGKPIMYKYSSDYKEISRFYVSDESKLYVLDIEKEDCGNDDNEGQEEKSGAKDSANKLRWNVFSLKARKKEKGEVNK